MVSFPVSSSRDARARDESSAPESNIGSPVPHTSSRLTKSEVANYINIVADLESDDHTDLAWQLSHPSRKNRQTHRLNDALEDERRSIRLDINEDDDDIDIDLEAEVERPMTATPALRRIDGPEFTPSYQDVNFGPSSSASGKKRKRGVDSKLDERDSMRWPISTQELEKNVQGRKGDKIERLEDSIKSFIQSYIRSNNLKHPSWSSSSNKSQGHNAMDDSLRRESLDIELELDTNLPENLISSSKELLNKALVNLAIVRPSDLGKNRKYMGTIDWNGLLGAISMEREFQPLVKRTNNRLRGMYGVEEYDLLSHRLNALESHPNESEPSLLDDLYESVLPKKNYALRPHQSQKELETRAERRRKKEEAKLKKSSNNLKSSS